MDLNFIISKYQNVYIMQYFVLNIGGKPIEVSDDVHVPKHLVNALLDLGAAIISNALTILITISILVTLNIRHPLNSV